MTEPTKVDTPDARQASMSRVVTQDALLASLVAPTSEEPAKEESKAEDKQKEGEQKPKKSPQERIVELAHKRREAEAEAADAKRERDILRTKLQALEAQAAPIEATARPKRESFANDDDYTDALADWKADQAIARRETQQAQARQQAEQAEIAQQWDKRQQKAIDAIEDYAEVIGKSEVQVPPYVHQALLESEQGPQIAYFLALNPDEAKRIAGMKPLAAIKHIAALERELAEHDEDEKPAPKVTEPPKKSKAPEPINPVKSTGASNPGKAESFEEYKRRRQAK